MRLSIKSIRFFSLLPLLVLLYRPAVAGETEQRRVTSFDGIRVSGNLTLFIEEGREESLRIEVDGIELDRVMSEVAENSLTVRTKPGVFPETYKIKAYVTYRKIRDLRASVGAKLYGRSILTGDWINVDVASGAFAELKVNLENLELNIVSGGELTVTGRARTQETTVNTAGKLNAFDLECDNAYIRVNTGGVGRVKVTKLLEANVATGGSLRYKGSPVKQSIKKSTGGAVSEILE